MMRSLKTSTIREGIKRLNESWPSVLNQLSNAQKNQVRRVLGNLNIDIENTPASSIEIVSNRDPRLKSGMTIFDFGGRSRDHIAVYVNGNIVIDVTVPGTDWKYASQCSWKTILSTAETIYHMDFDPESQASIKQMRQDRKASQRGVVRRYTDKDAGVSPYTGDRYTRKEDEFGNVPGRRDKLDKSGYVLDPDKYVNMLADAGVKNGEAILQHAKDVYRQLTTSAADHLDDPDDGWNGSEYMDCITYLARTFRNLRKALNDYNQSVEKYGDEVAGRWNKVQTMGAIKDLRQYVKKAEELLNK